MFHLSTAVMYHCFVTAKSSFVVWFWEEQSSHFIKESSVKRTGQLGLCQVDSDSAQVRALPAFPPSSLSTWYGWLWFCFRIRISKVIQQFVSSSDPLYTVSRSWRVSLILMDSFFFLQSCPLYFVFSLLSFSSFLSFSLFLVFLSVPLWTSQSLNSIRQHIISSLKDLPLSSHTFLRNVFCVSSLTNQSFIWFTDFWFSFGFVSACYPSSSLVSFVLFAHFTLSSVVSGNKWLIFDRKKESEEIIVSFACMKNLKLM